jgi:hypothetical protein
VEQEVVDGLDFARNTGSSYVFAIILSKLYLIRKLKGLPLDLRLFDDTEVDEDDYEQYLESDANLTFPAYAYWTRELQACVFAGDYASALDAVVKAQGMLLGPSLVERNIIFMRRWRKRGLSTLSITFNPTGPNQIKAYRTALQGACYEGPQALLFPWRGVYWTADSCGA